jgi:hypothetical protein
MAPKVKHETPRLMTLPSRITRKSPRLVTKNESTSCIEHIQSTAKMNETFVPNDFKHVRWYPAGEVKPVPDSANNTTRSNPPPTDSDTKPLVVRRSRIKFPTFKATLMLDGQPIVMTRKVDGLDNTKSVYELDKVFLDIFDTNKKAITIKRTLIATNAESCERDEGSEPASQLAQDNHTKIEIRIATR